MSDWKPGYKILDLDRGSFVVHSCKPYYLVYPPLTIVHARPGYGPMCVFDEKLCARVFAGCMTKHCIIVKCAYRRSRRLFLSKGLTIAQCPIGTVLADAVYCLE